VFPKIEPKEASGLAEAFSREGTQTTTATLSAIFGWQISGKSSAGVNGNWTSLADAIARQNRWNAKALTSGVAGIEVSTGAHSVSCAEKDGVLAAVIGNPEIGTFPRHGGTTAEDILDAYAHSGIDLPRSIRGSFTLAIVSSDTALLAVDRFGRHPLYYAEHDGELVFGSSLALVAKRSGLGKSLEPQGIFDYFFFHCIPSPGTIYRGIRKLQPSECVQLRDQRMDARRYWSLHFDDNASPDFERQSRDFHNILRSAVAKADGEAVGAFLSGGTDSSTIAGMLSRVRERRIDTYSIGFAADGFDEMRYARIAVKHFDTVAHEYYLTPDDIVTALPIIAAAYDEPFGNASAVPTYFCAKLAADSGARRLLAGDGGDELFGGNARYAKQLLFEYYQRIPMVLRRELFEPLLEMLPGQNLPGPIRKLRRYIAQSNLPLPDRLESYNFLAREPLVDIFEPEFLALIDAEHPYLLLRDSYRAADARHAINRMMHLDFKFTLADNDLRKVMRMCEVAGVEVQFPMLDTDLVEFSATLPPNYKVRRNALRWFFKESLKDFLPQAILQKEKHGFGLPFGLWLRTDLALRSIAKDELERFGQRGILKPTYLDRITAKHGSGDVNYYGVMIWQIISMEHWLRAHGH
jgi:asparagine synthase (glutamine-hydrolysing)